VAVAAVAVMGMSMSQKSQKDKLCNNVFATAFATVRPGLLYAAAGLIVLCPNLKK
jgi:hypothetical protein